MDKDKNTPDETIDHSSMSELEKLPDLVLLKILQMLDFQSILLLRLTNKNMHRRIPTQDDTINRYLYRLAWTEYKRLHLKAFSSRLALVETAKKLELTVFAERVLFRQQYFDAFYRAVRQQQLYHYDQLRFPRKFEVPRSMFYSDMRLNRLMPIRSKPFKSYTPILLKSPSSHRTIRLIPKFVRRRPLVRETIMVVVVDTYIWSKGNQAHRNRRQRELDNSVILVIGYGLAILELLARHNYEVDVHQSQVLHLDWLHEEEELNTRVKQHEHYSVQSLPCSTEIVYPDDFEGFKTAELVDVVPK